MLGAGFTGLATARRLALARPDWRILLLDAGRAGFGASGRSSGFVVDLPDFAAHLAAADRDRYVRLARAGIEQLRQLVRDHAIACAWDERGWIRAAAGEDGLRFLRTWPDLLAALGIPCQPLDREAMAAVTGSTFYRAGLRLPGAVLVQPAALARGLVAALPGNVELFEDTPVARIDRHRGEFRVAAAGGAVAAERLFVTLNAHAPALGLGRRQVVPVFTFGSSTRVLTEAERDALGGEAEWGLVAMDAMGSTVRRTRDQRIFVRNTLYYSPRPVVPERLLAKARDQHRKALAARFPALAGIGFEHTWSGLMAVSRNRLPCFGALAPNLFLAVGFSGVGIAMGTASGTLLAELALGRDSALLADHLALPPPPRLPPEPLRSLAGKGLTAWMNSRAGACL